MVLKCIVDSSSRPVVGSEDADLAVLRSSMVIPSVEMMMIIVGTMPCVRRGEASANKLDDSQ